MFQSLQAHVALGGADGASRDGEQVDEPFGTEQRVHLFLATSECRRETPQNGHLIGGIMIDMGIGVLSNVRREPVDHGFECGLFGLAVMRPPK